MADIVSENEGDEGGKRRHFSLQMKKKYPLPGRGFGIE
jgi:hypothetical protein